MSWVVYALMAPALYTLTNFIEKFLIDKKVKDTAVLVIFGGPVAFVIGILILLLKGFPLIEPRDLFLIVLSGTFYTFYLLPYYKALELDDASRVVPFFQFTPVIVLILSAIFLKEGISSKQLLGALFIIFGSFILSVEKADTKIFKPRKSLYYMLLSSLLLSLAFIIFRFVVKTNDFWLTFGYQHLGIALGAFILLLIPSYRNRFNKQKREIGLQVWAFLGLNEAISLLGQLAFTTALLLASAPLVSIVLGTQPIFLLIFGLILSFWFPKIIKEDIRKSTIGIKLVTVGLILTGLYFIYYS